MPDEKPFLNELSKLKKKFNSINQPASEKKLIKLMNLANKYYDKVYLKFKNNPNVNAFDNCSQNFNEIKLLLKNKKATPLINNLYIEAWISTLYSDVHALNLEIETEDQLNELIGKIQAIGTDFEKLSAKNETSNLNLSVKGAVDLLKYIQNFENTWKVNKIKLLADIHYNLGLTLEEKSNLEKALLYFMQSKKLYNEAAKITAAVNMNFKKRLSENGLSKEKLEKAADQTEEKIQSLLSGKNPTESQKKLHIHLQRIPDFPSKRIIVNEFPFAQSIEENRAIEIKSLTEKKGLTSKIKRKSNEESTYLETKKQKIDLWAIERKKILEVFHSLKIDIDLDKIRLKIGSISKQKAIAYNNRAIYLVEDINNIKLNYSHSEKIKFLNDAIKYLTNSLEIYKNINFTEEKNNIEHCIKAISSSLKNIIEAYINQITKPEDSLSMKTQASPTKPIRSISEEKLREYQPIFSNRLVCKFFMNSFSKDNTQNTNSETIEKIASIYI